MPNHFADAFVGVIKKLDSRISNSESVNKEHTRAITKLQADVADIKKNMDLILEFMKKSMLSE